MTATTSRHTTTEDERHEFHTLLQNWAAAIVANDADRIAAFTEPDWEIVGPTSGPVPLERFLALVRDGSLTHSEMSFEVLSVRRQADVAVVVAHGTNRGELRGEPFTADEWVSEFFVRRDGRWRCRLTALTPNETAR